MEKAEIPLYKKIRNVLQEELDAKIWQPGEPIPTEEELQQRFGVSRVTVRKALEIFEEENRIIKLQGKGTFVKPIIVNNPGFMSSFTESVGSLGFEPSSRVLSVKYGNDKKASQRLSIENDEKVLKIERIRFANAIPVSLQLMYVNPSFLNEEELKLLTNELFLRLELDKHLKSLYQMLYEDYGYHMIKGERTIESISLPMDIADKLNTNEGSPAFLVNWIGYNEENQALSYSKMYNLGAYFKYSNKMNEKSIKMD